MRCAAPIGCCKKPGIQTRASVTSATVLASRHSNLDGTECRKKKEIDLGGKQVLVSKDFVYYGSAAIELPSQFPALIVGRGHKRFPHAGKGRGKEEEMIAKFEVLFHGLPRGIQGLPRDWGDEPERCGCGVRKRPDGTGGGQGKGKSC